MPDTPFTSSLSLNTYPERNEVISNGYDDFVATIIGKLHARLYTRQSAFMHFYQQVKQQLKSLKAMDKIEYAEHLAQLRYAMVRDGLTDAHIEQSFAFIYFTIIRKLKMRPYKVQLMAGWVMTQGKLAEMETGEGKTLTATFPACTAAMAKIPVHIITANDYLAERDAMLMQPVYQALGLSVGIVTANTPADKRRAAYACNITYCTSKQLALDYLRDRMKQGLQQQALRQQLQQQLNQVDSPDKLPLLRGLCYAIVDEADSILIDDARVPLILARDQNGQTNADSYSQALSIAQGLTVEQDFQLSSTEPCVQLTAAGQQQLSEISRQPDAHGPANEIEQYVLLALRALFVLQRDKHYLVKDNRIQIIDENTGRSQADRSWQKGLQQMIECKEGCSLSNEKTILARISFQRFFRRYLHLAGMTGTAREVAGELHRTYTLDVVTIPPRKSNRRKYLPTRIFPHAATKWQVCLKRIEKVHKRGRPILVGTRSLKDSEYLSMLLKQAQLPHQLLNAQQDKNEAKIIAQAGKTGQITIATNMAGRGTDIRLTKEAKKLGGLHVISMELNDARRIDRQLYGRCARQGNRGSCEAFISLEDTIFEQLPAVLRQRLRHHYTGKRYLTLWLGRGLIRWAQWSQQRTHAKIRRLLLKWDRQQEQTLAVSGKRE